MSHLRGIVVLNDTTALLGPLQETFLRKYQIYALAYGHLQFSEIYMESDVVKLKSRISNDVRNKYYEYRKKLPQDIFHLRYVRQLEHLVNANGVEVLILVDQPDKEMLSAMKVAFNVPIITIRGSGILPIGTVVVTRGEDNNNTSVECSSTGNLKVVRKVKTLIPVLLKLEEPRDFYVRLIMGCYFLFTIVIFFRNGILA